jgi:hypothetical protein
MTDTTFGASYFGYKNAQLLSSGPTGRAEIIGCYICLKHESTVVYEQFFKVQMQVSRI